MLTEKVQKKSAAARARTRTSVMNVDGRKWASSQLSPLMTAESFKMKLSLAHSLLVFSLSLGVCLGLFLSLSHSVSPISVALLLCITLSFNFPRSRHLPLFLSLIRSLCLYLSALSLSISLHSVRAPLTHSKPTIFGSFVRLGLPTTQRHKNCTSCFGMMYCRCHKQPYVRNVDSSSQGNEQPHALRPVQLLGNRSFSVR